MHVGTPVCGNEFSTTCTRGAYFARVQSLIRATRTLPGILVSSFTPWTPKQYSSWTCAAVFHVR